MPLPVNERDSLDGKKKAKLVNSIHDKVRLQIEKKSEQYASQANKGRRRVTFKPRDWVWVHMKKERFLADELKSHPFLVHFSDMFLSKKTDLCAEIWSN